MAIADIIERIASDARAEADGIIAAARERAEAREAETQREAAREAERRSAAVEERARTEAGTLRANARLEARDRLLAAKRERAEAVLEAARGRIEQLPDDRYAALLAARIADVALPGQAVRIAAADRGRLASLATLLAKVGVDVRVDDAPADTARGLVLEGRGVRVEVSPAALVDARRDELLHLAAGVLFGEEEG